MEHYSAEEISVDPAVCRRSVAGQYSSLTRGSLPPSPWAASLAARAGDSSRSRQEREKPMRISVRLLERREELIGGSGLSFSCCFGSGHLNGGGDRTMW